MTSSSDIIHKRTIMTKKKAELEEKLKNAEMRVERLKTELSRKAARLERSGLPPRMLARMQKLSGVVLHHLIGVRGWEWFEQGYIQEAMAALDEHDRSFYEDTLRGMFAPVDLSADSLRQIMLFEDFDTSPGGVAGPKGQEEYEEFDFTGSDFEDSEEAGKELVRKAG